jgi:hypothetical protein
MSQQVEAASTGEVDVEQNDIGGHGRQQLQRGGIIASPLDGADFFPSIQHYLNALCDQEGIIYDEYRFSGHSNFNRL